MTQQQKQAGVTQEDIRIIKNDVAEIGTKLNLVLDALVGNSLSKDGGVVKRMFDIESLIPKVNSRLAEVERVYKEKLFYMKVLWFVGGGFLMTLVSLIFKR